MNLTTKTCVVCGKELPLSDFNKVRGGHYTDTCKECISAKKRENKQKKIDELNNRHIVYNALFQDKTPREVCDIMWQGKEWLEARNYEIVLSGTYVERKRVIFNKDAKR